MRKFFYTLLLLGATSIGATAQWIVNDDFNAAGGSALTSNGWTNTDVAITTNPINTISPGLSFTDYFNSGVGNAASLTVSGMDLYLGGTGVTADSIYASGMINVSAAQTGAYFFAMLPDNSVQNFVGRVFVKSTTGGYLMGLAKGSTGTTYGATVLSFNTTYAFTLKYAFRSGSSTDDEVTLYVHTTSMPATEPTTPEVGPLSGTADAPNISRIALRQATASTSATLVVDGVRLGGPWSNGALPVSYTSFTASKQASSNLLKWSTASESNNSHFEVQRSLDGKSFETVARVKGNGTSNKVHNYSYSDVSAPVAKVVYYRLKQVDFDGKSELSKMVSVTSAVAQNAIQTTLPNPFNSDLSIGLSVATAGIAQVELLDMIGKVHYSNNMNVAAGTTNISINTMDIPEGIYFVRVALNGETFTRKVVKK